VPADSAPQIGNWGRWGAADELGAVNLITPEVVIAAAGLVKSGKVIPLGSPVGKNGAISAGRNPTWHVTVKVAQHDDPGRGRAEDMLTVHTHAHSHLDALSHVWYDGLAYNGHPSTVVGRGGAAKLRIDRIGGIVTRGVLLDLTAGGTRQWDIGEAIEPDDLVAALGRAGVELRAGDALMLRTGWFDLMATGDARFHAGEPGLSPAAVDWLLRADPAVLAIDNFAFEIMPPPAGANPLQVHETVLRDHGVYLVELLDLSALAAAGASEFLFVTAPLLIEKGLGSPVNPLAIL
jgi:kynurenine formamidase